MIFILIASVIASILVYDGDGVSSVCLDYTLSTFRELSSLPVDTISAEQLLNTEWEVKCRALVIPGGRDLPYKRDLEPLVTQRIQNWVISRGGSYIGICAGAYFACQSISFEQGTEYEVVGDRDLALYQGVAVGALYRYPQARILKLQSENCHQDIQSYYMGGPYFKGDDSFQVILRYPENGEAAVVLGERGQGKVLLMGVHLEMDHLVEGLALGNRIMGWRSQDERRHLLRQLLIKVLN